MADSTGLGLWGTLWQGFEGATGKAAEAPPVGDLTQLGFWGTLWMNRGEGFDGKAAEAISTRRKQNPQLASIGRMMNRV